MENNNDRHEYCTGGFHPDDIVISGIAGRFPKCDSIADLCEALLTKKYLLEQNTERYEKGAVNLPFSSSGTLHNLDKLDAEFFGITFSNAHAMDPQQRMILEASYEAMADAGYDACTELRGARVGVYTAMTNSDEKDMLQGTAKYKSNFAVGFLRCMFANRCSHAFDFHGPSFTVDTACSSSFVALWSAFNDLKEGRIDAALVNAGELCLSPDVTSFYYSSGIISPTARSSPFDATADGIVRTEAVTALFVQKASVARRAYATIMNIQHSSAGYVPEGVYVPSEIEETKLFKEVLVQCNLSPDDIQYIEAHGTGTAVGDPIEVNSIANVYLTNTRKEPLYIGSVKSNVGHSEAAAGHTGAIKVLLAFETGFIAPNQNYENPHPNCSALVDEKIQVVKTPLPVFSPYIPVSSFGFGGSMVNAILKQNPIEYNTHSIRSELPRLVLYPATTETAVQFLFDYIEEHVELKNEFFALVNKLAFSSPGQKPFRGYALYQKKQPLMQIKQSTSIEKREVWFVMTGMGCQWPGMGQQMMQFEVFAKSITKSAEVLNPLGIDLFEILKKDSNLLEVDRCITPAFVSIAAIQIALIDLLRNLEILPDHIIGHSTGELACAYADGCCTAEQIILSAYWRGKSVEKSNLAPGLMAAVGLSWEEATQMCPENVYPACHNADDSVTISGLKDPLENFVAELQQKNIFARVVNAYGFAFHCPHIYPASKHLHDALSQVFGNPQPRTQRWISTSYPENEWDKEESKMAGAEYFVHNLMSNVLFNDILKKIPPNAITIEIGPHFLLQSILKRSIGSDASYFGLMKRNNDNNVEFFLESIGKLYTEGLNPKIENLYPPVKFPVPRGTPVISDLIKWNHSQSWDVTLWNPSSTSYSHTFELNAEDSYLLDHFIDGRSLFPATGYIFLAWHALAKKLEKKFEELNILIEDFKIHKATIISTLTLATFSITITDSLGMFEINEGTSLVASGKIFCQEKTIFIKPEPSINKDNTIFISGEDLYNELKIYGYEYGPAFRRLVESNIDGSEGFIEFNDWISFMDAMILFSMFTKDVSKFVLPVGALNIKINPGIFIKNVEENRNKNLSGVPVKFYPSAGVCRSSGIEIVKLEVDNAPQNMKSDNSVMEMYKFVPYNHSSPPDPELKFENYMTACNKVIENIEETLKVNLNHGKMHLGLNSDASFIDFEIELADEYKLYSILENIKNMGKMDDKILQKEIFANFVSDIGKDLSNTLLVNEYSLRYMFDIISENSFRKLGVLEINNNFTPVLPKVVEVVEKYSMVKFKHKMLVCRGEEYISKDLVNEYNIQLFSYNKISTAVQENSQSVVISSLSISSEREARNLIHSLNSFIETKGFVLLFHKNLILPQENLVASLLNEKIEVVPSGTLQKILVEEGLVTVAKLSNNVGSDLYLLRQITTTTPLKVINLTSDIWFDELKSSIVESTETTWLISEDCPSSGIIGMVNCLRHEPGGDRIRCIFIPEKSKAMEKPFSFEDPFYRCLLETDLLMNVYKDDSWGSFRHIRIDKRAENTEVDYSYCNIKRYGDFSSLEWMESAVKYMKTDDERFTHVYYSALNFRDVMLASGKISQITAQAMSGSDSCVLGLEVAGRSRTGKRVAAICRSRGIATASILTDVCFEVPENWTLQDAATVPITYSTCYYGMIMRGCLLPGESILIHSGTGGIGLSAINIALSMNCEVYTTVGTEEKRRYLLKNYPRLKPENIGNSRNTSFETMIMERTNGNGVDMVLNSLADDKFHASIRCVGKHGRFIEIGKYDLAKDNKIGLKFFLNNITFHGVFLDQIVEESVSCKRKKKALMQLLLDGIKTGAVKPLPRTVFRRDEVEKAFRFMGAGTHIGKVIIEIQEEEKSKIIIPKSFRLAVTPATYFYDHKVYIVVGGLGGFGIEVTKWILSKGAKNIVLTTRYGARTPYHHLCLKRWKDRGYNVIISTRDVSIKEEALKLLNQVAGFGPVGGIFNSAVVLHDAFLENVTFENFKSVCAPKADATVHLDGLSRSMCQELDHFVCFSSISCGKGNAGQMNYGYANSVMERICEQRRTDGLPGLSVQWGIIGEVGVVHRHMGDDAMIAGVGAQRVKSCLETLDLSCQMPHPVICSYVLKESSRKKGDQKDILQQFARIFGLKDPSEFNSLRSFGEMGVDSMIGIEIKHLMETTLDITLTMKEIQEMKIADVKALLEKNESQKAETGTAMMSTTCLTLPKSFVQKEAVVSLNSRKDGDAVFIIDLNCVDISELRVIGESIPHPAFALLWSEDTPATDVQSLASWYLGKIRNITNKQSHLIALSASSVPALEILLQCEKSDKCIKSFTIIDGSSSLLKTAAHTNGPTASEADILCDFVQSFNPGMQNKIKDQISKCTSLDQQVRIVAELFTKSSTEAVNKKELSEIITMHVKKGLVVENYRPKAKLATEILVIEDSTKVLANDVAEVKMALSEISSGKINIHRISNIKNFTEDSVSRIIPLLNLQ